MMLNLKTGIIGQMRNLGTKLIGLVLTAIILRQFYTAIKGTLWLAGPGAAVPANFGEASAVGQLLFTSYVYPLELMAVLLLVAIVGALVLAGKERP
jgi:NADH-quinone oxidoreductase subunit J